MLPCCPQPLVIPGRLFIEKKRGRKTTTIPRFPSASPSAPPKTWSSVTWVRIVPWKPRRRWVAFRNGIFFQAMKKVKTSALKLTYLLKIDGSKLEDEIPSITWSFCRGDVRFREGNYVTRWWFQAFLVFIPISGEMIQFDEHMGQMGWFNYQLEINMEPEKNVLQKWKRKNIHTKHDNCWVPAPNFPGWL